MSTVPEPHMSPEEYLERERKAEWKSEYFDGEVFAMSGASRCHVLITRNVTVALHQRLQGKPYEVYGSNMRVRVSPMELYTYPDVTVTCGDEQFLDDEVDTLLNPLLIVEVLSKSTSNYDRGEKFESYRTLPSFREYLCVSQDRVQVEQFQRQETGQWLLTVYSDRSAAIPLPGLAIELPLAEIYESVLPSLPA